MTQRFNTLLMHHAQERDPTQRTAIERQLWADYGTEQAVFVLDMSGFSAIVAQHGVVHYLSMVRRMQLTTRPVVESYGGRIVKFEADNCFAAFPDVQGAVQTAVALNQSFAAANLVTRNSSDIHIACGVDYGQILMVDDRDFFGHAVNRASKLGEDIAKAGQILITEEARQLMPDGLGFRFERRVFHISAIEIPAFQVSLNPHASAPGSKS